MPKQTKLSDNAEIYQPRKEQTEKEKLREMPFKKKLAYLKEYYGLQALIAIVIIAVVSYFLYSIFGPKTNIQLEVAIINNTIQEEVLAEYKDSFVEYLQLDSKTEDVNINSSFYFNNEATGFNMRQILSTYVATQEIDIIIAPKSEFENFAYNGYFIDLSEQLPTDLYSAMTKRFYISDMVDNPDKVAYGINLSDSSLFKDNGFNDTDPYMLGIVANAKHSENSVEFIRYLFQLTP